MEFDKSLTNVQPNSKSIKEDIFEDIMSNNVQKKNISIKLENKEGDTSITKKEVDFVDGFVYQTLLTIEPTNLDLLMKKKVKLGDECFTCANCGRNLNSKHALRYHLKSHIMQNHIKIDDRRETQQQFENKSMQTEFTMNSEKKLEQPYTQSVNIKKENNLNDCNFEKTKLRKKSFTCSNCHNTFNSKSKLTSHIMKCIKERIHKCNVCEKSFTLLCNLNRHNLIHSGEKPHKCNVCEKSFNQLSNLNRHNLIHSGEKPHKCNVCEKSFRSKYNFGCHIMTHTGEKPYKCNICEKSFTQLSHLNRHNLIHSGKKPHKCNVCEKSFTQLSYLKQHKLIHTGKGLVNL